METKHLNTWVHEWQFKHKSPQYHTHTYYKISYDTIMQYENYQGWLICFLNTQQGQSVPRTIDSWSFGKQEHREGLDVWTQVSRRQHIKTSYLFPQVIIWYPLILVNTIFSTVASGTNAYLLHIHPYRHT